MRFLEALKYAKKSSQNVVIPDIKCFSPKEGDLMKGRNPVDYALSLQKSGAPVLSVVTEEKEFHGSMEILKSIAAAVSVPILRKDFIHTVDDLRETIEAGASAILLMCSCLEREELKELYYAALELGLDPFVETHKAEDFALVNELGAKLVGINNRDILVLERDNGDVSNTCRLIDNAPEDAFVITESSIKNADEVRRAISAGADAALVGTAILQAEDTEAFYKMLCRKKSIKVCGLMNKDDVEKCVSLGVDRIGFVVDYPKYVPWNLAPDEAEKLRKQIPSGFQACMVSGGDNDKYLELAERIKPDCIQIHCKEKKSQLKELVPALAKLGIKTISPVPTNTDDCLEQFGTADIEEGIRIMCELGIDELLVDPRHGDNVACTGFKADLELFRTAEKIALEYGGRVVLAGGISADNIAEMLEESGAQFIDVMSGSEDAPGAKNADKIRKMIDAL